MFFGNVKCPNFNPQKRQSSIKLVAQKVFFPHFFLRAPKKSENPHLKLLNKQKFYLFHIEIREKQVKRVNTTTY